MAIDPLNSQPRDGNPLVTRSARIPRLEKLNIQHLQAIKLLAQGLSVADVARQIGASYEAVRSWSLSPNFQRVLCLEILDNLRSVALKIVEYQREKLEQGEVGTRELAQLFKTAANIIQSLMPMTEETTEATLSGTGDPQELKRLLKQRWSLFSEVADSLEATEAQEPEPSAEQVPSSPETTAQ